MKNLVSNRLFWPAAVLAALLLANFLWNDSFFDITVRDGNLYGAPVESCAVRRRSCLSPSV